MHAWMPVCMYVQSALTGPNYTHLEHCIILPMYVCMYACMYVCMYVCMSILRWMCTNHCHDDARMYAYVYVCSIGSNEAMLYASSTA
jgi:hypothetical protein